MAVKLVSKKPVQVQAIQLVAQTNPNIDNAQEIATWCNGRAVWNYDGEKGEHDVIVVLAGGYIRAEETDWVVRTINGVFSSMSDKDFREEFDTEDF